MTLFNGNCDNCIYENGKPIICTACGSMVKGGLCLTCDFREKNLYNCDPNAYSFDNTNYFPKSQYENHLCSLCGNNSHDGYNCQQQFPFVHEQEPSYNQNYDGNYFSHELPSFPYCDNYGKSHETFQCQPITFQIDFFGSDQIQTPQYPEIHFSSQETSNQVFQANHSIQNEESFENPSNEIVVSNSNQEKEEPSQESDIHHLIEECSTEVSEKQKMEGTMLELVKICQEKEFLCIHDDIDDLIESALNSKVFLINSNSQHLDKKEQKVKNVVEQPAERGNRSIQSLQNFRVVHKRYEHLSITPEMESDEVTESNAENLLPIPSECEVTLEYKKECDLPISENSPVCDNHSDIFSDSKIDDDILVYDDDFEDIEYVEASLFDPENVSIEEENNNFSPEFETFCNYTEETRSGNNTHADNSLPEYDSFCFEIELDQERLINLMKNDIFDSSNDPLLEEVDLFLASDDSIPRGIENFVDDPERDIRFLEELLIDEFIISHESFDSNFEDNPSIPRPPQEPPDAKINTGEEITVVMNKKDEDVGYSSFIFVIYPEMFPLLLSAESEDTIFDPGISD
nr:hypothetical protein [Tanacetum cinerariifolium]